MQQSFSRKHWPHACYAMGVDRVGIWNEAALQIDFITEGVIPDGITPKDGILSGMLTTLGSDSAIIIILK